MSRQRANVYLAALVIGSVLVASYESFAYSHGTVPASTLATVWPFAFFVLLILWVVEDSKSYPSIYKPHDYGFLIYLFGLPYLPYYLWRTRRFAGLLLFASFVVLFFLGYLAMLAIYAAS